MSLNIHGSLESVRDLMIRGTYSVYYTWEGSMSLVSRVLLVFRFWRIRQSHELCEVVLWNEHQGVLLVLLGVGF
jgi:hypothetical protein